MSIKTKEEILQIVTKIIDNVGLSTVEINAKKPWGAYFRLEDNDAEKFIDTYFADIKDKFDTFNNLSPKYLLVAPGERLSWQYHYRRAEHWRVLKGTVGVKLSDNDTEPIDYDTKSEGKLVQFPALKRHRLIGLDDWGVVVEIWQHTEILKPSDESDIVRVADDYNR
ncbi:MAG: phosphoheptose isomerase [Patescibacteria group bacterium]|jgi:mannose-6-phosphate isomerase-like protein (cupin superfamily)|nr:phosphoheptose isomerase [Patescibacteria group bacterium]